jgi:methionine-rich copper-binding protein CopC
MKRFRLFMICAGLLSAPLVALAHAHLERSEPTNDSTVITVPDHFTLMFSEAAHLTALTLQKDGDAAPQKIVGLPKGASEHFSIPAPKLTAGVYTLKFRNVAADDNHVTSGTIRFTVAASAKAAVAGTR